MTAKLQYRAAQENIGGLDSIVVYPEDADGTPIIPVALAVFCHGYGAGGDDLVPLANELLQMMGTAQPIAIAFPAAPLSLESEGMPGARAWWSLSIQRLLSALEDGRYELVREEVPDGIEEARDLLSANIQELLNRYGLTHDRLLLGGFSQGAMLAVETACIGLEKAPATLCLYSGALICERRWTPNIGKLAECQVVQSHGRIDPILPLQVGVWLRELIASSGAEPSFIEFNGPHTIPQEAMVQTAHALSQLASNSTN